MRALFVAAGFAVLAGCTFGINECDMDRPCTTAGAVCMDGFCTVTSTGGGTGGGSTGGGAGGGTTGGGTTTGGGMGGGTGGGTGNARCDQTVTASCAGWQECAPDENGGTCVDADYELTWMTPAELAEFNTDMVSGFVTVTKADGGAVSLTEVPVKGATAPFVGANGTYSGMLSLQAPDGVKTFVAGWQDGGPFEERSVRLDTLEPEVIVSAEPRPTSLPDGEPNNGGFWKKDEAAIIRIVVDGGIAPTAGNITTSWLGLVSPATCMDCSGSCGCFAVDLAGSTLNAQRGPVPVTVSGLRDVAGNEVQSQTVNVNVTRFKWERTSALAGSTALSPVAVDRLGRVVWSAENTTPAPITSIPRYLVTSTSQDGGTNWASLGDGSVVAGPVLGAATGWVSTSYGSSGFTDFPLSDGDLRGLLLRTCVGGGDFTGDMALSVLDGGVEIPLAVRAGRINSFVGGNCEGYNLQPPPGDLNARPSLVALSRDGGTEAFVAYLNDGSMWKATLTGSTWARSGEASLPSGVQPYGLFQDGMSFVGGGGGVAGNGNFFSLSSEGNLPPSVLSTVSATNAGPAALGVGYLVYGTNTGLLKRDLYMVGNLVDGGTPVATTGLGNLQGTTPVIGGGGFVYFSANSGVVSVRRASDLGEVWRYTPGTASAATANSALDVYRGANGAPDCTKPLGVYYSLTRTGSTATLRAILVDSKGLDRDAPWPKYQRDNANTGNSSLSLDPWSCDP